VSAYVGSSKNLKDLKDLRIGESLGPAESETAPRRAELKTFMAPSFRPQKDVFPPARGGGLPAALDRIGLSPFSPEFLLNRLTTPFSVRCPGNMLLDELPHEVME